MKKFSLKTKKFLGIFILISILVVLIGGCGPFPITKFKNKAFRLMVKMPKETLEICYQCPICRIVILAVNLECIRTAIHFYYCMHEGKFPRSLDELVPEFLDFIPPGDWRYNPAIGKVTSPTLERIYERFLDYFRRPVRTFSH